MNNERKESEVEFCALGALEPTATDPQATKEESFNVLAVYDARLRSLDSNPNLHGFQTRTFGECFQT